MMSCVIRSEKDQAVLSSPAVLFHFRASTMRTKTILLAVSDSATCLVLTIQDKDRSLMSDLLKLGCWQKSTNRPFRSIVGAPAAITAFKDDLGKQQASIPKPSIIVLYWGINIIFTSRALPLMSRSHFVRVLKP